MEKIRLPPPTTLQSNADPVSGSDRRTFVSCHSLVTKLFQKGHKEELDAVLLWMLSFPWWQCVRCYLLKRKSLMIWQPVPGPPASFRSVWTWVASRSDYRTRPILAALRSRFQALWREKTHLLGTVGPREMILSSYRGLGMVVLIIVTAVQLLWLLFGASLVLLTVKSSIDKWGSRDHRNKLACLRKQSKFVAELGTTKGLMITSNWVLTAKCQGAVLGVIVCHLPSKK